jgi:hypothetical protein
MLKEAILLILAVLCLGCMQAQDMSGTWKLNVEKSDWRGVRRPLSVVVTVEHQEPILKYSGWVTYPDNPPRGFSFDGAIDGKPHPALRSYGQGSSQMRRLGWDSVESDFRSDDGRFREGAKTILSADGRQMIRSLHLNSPNGREDWTEVYEKE